VIKRDFYSNWDFSSEVKKNVYFSQLPSLHEVGHFPRYLKQSITLDPATRHLLRIEDTEYLLDGSSDFKTIYDKMCIKYINMLETVPRDARLVLASPGKIDSKSSHLFPFNSLFHQNLDGSTNDDEEIVSPDLTHVGGALFTAGLVGTNYTFTGLEKFTISAKMSGYSWDGDATWRTMDCIKRDVGLRTYQNILDGEPAPSEPLLYEVEKFDIQGNKINSFFYPARLFHQNESPSQFDFIDTQIRHGEIYNYTLKVHQLVYGTKYSFTGYTPDEQELAEVDLHQVYKVNLDFDIRILPIELSTWSTSITSTPSLAPSIFLIPQKNKAGMPKFRFETVYGEENHLHPAESYMPLSEEEHSTVSKTIERYSIEDNSMTFRTEYQNKNYEVYRISHPPRSLSDFENSLIATVSPLHATLTGYSPAAIFEDNIQSNREYYYLFRSIDVWGTPSLPAGPYRYEISKDAEAFITNFTPYEMLPEVPKQNLKMKKMFKITPSWKHILFPDMQEIDDASSAFDLFEDKELKNKIQQKMTEESIFWDKTYKIRVTSKKTGRKIDIIFKPKLTTI